MRVEFDREAEEEMLEAARYYQKLGSNLGAEFLAEVDTALDLISDTPTRWQWMEDDIRRFVLRRFHYLIVYQVLEDHILVLAVQHSSRHPDVWKSRLP